MVAVGSAVGLAEGVAGSVAEAEGGVVGPSVCVRVEVAVGPVPPEQPTRTKAKAPTTARTRDAVPNMAAG